MSSLILNPSNSGSGSVTLNIFGDDTEYNINLPKTNGTLVSTVNGKTANNNGSVTIDVGVKSVNGVAPDSKGNVAMKVQSVASSDEVVAGTDNTKMMTPLRTKESVQQFSPTDYVTGLSVSGQTVTFTKKNGTTGKITTQDTKYTHPNSGVHAGTYNTVTVDAQGHVTGGSNVTYGNFPSGTQLLFYQSSAPTGWTKVTGIGNSAVRIVEDTTGGTSAGSIDFSNVFKPVNTSSTTVSGTISNKQLTVSMLAPHTHNVRSNRGGAGDWWIRGDTGGVGTSNTYSVESTGSGSVHNHNFSGDSHSHTVNLSIKYINVIVCRKD
nr:MAG TPA: hypothetical protein [Caudoviricetes sp.]